MNTTIQKMSRKIFNLDNFQESKIVALSDKDKLYDNSISAVGCLFYKITNKKIKLLLIKYEDPNWQRLDDFGGQIDESDNTIEEAVIRETREESNHIICDEYLKNIFETKNYTSFYNKLSKYYCITVKVNDDFFPNTKVFGDLEITDNIKRKVLWYDYDKCKNDLAFRILKNQKLIDFLEKSTQ
jgi:ADP-ribose pyrophosphatase YjhB (NUDIX family)